MGKENHEVNDDNDDMVQVRPYPHRAQVAAGNSLQKKKKTVTSLSPHPQVSLNFHLSPSRSLTPDATTFSMIIASTSWQLRRRQLVKSLHLFLLPRARPNPCHTSAARARAAVLDVAEFKDMYTAESWVEGAEKW